MPAPQLAEIETVAHDLTERLTQADDLPRALWQIDGPATTGKSACLGRIGALLAETDLKPILVGPPAHYLDAAPLALVEAAEGLAEQQLLNGELREWSEPGVRWAKRIGELREWISANRGDVVLLCDQPRSWGTSRGDDGFFQDRGFDAAFMLASIGCRRVITGKLPVPVDPLDRFDLTAPTVEHSWLKDRAAWGELAPAVAALDESPLLERPSTPLVVRLLIAATALCSIEEVERRFVDNPTAHTLISFVGELAQAPANRRIWEAWVKLSLVRRELDAELLEELIPARATAKERDIVRHCLLFGEEELHMHDLLTLAAQRWRYEQRANRRAQGLVRAATQTLFDIHRGRFESFLAADSPRALRESMEAFHFASLSGDSDLIDRVQPIFSEQLDALGWSLSYEHRKFREAVRAFEAALEWDDRDDYAHHYLAYNLDRIGTRVDDVELHFRRAVELNPDHVWWRSRLVMFLIGRGRIGEAHAAWEDAVLVLGAGGPGVSPDTYERLHCWVAGALLSAGEVVFAREVLDQVPERAQAGIDIYAGLSQRADALLQLGEGNAVVPAWRLRPGWWESGPELLQFRFATGEQRVRWLAGRVESKDDEGIHVRAAVIEREGEEPTIAWLTLTTEEFDGYCRDEVSAGDIDVGEFIEMGIYVDPRKAKGQALTVVRVLPHKPWETPGLATMPAERHRDPEFALR